MFISSNFSNRKGQANSIGSVILECLFPDHGVFIFMVAKFNGEQEYILNRKNETLIRLKMANINIVHTINGFEIDTVNVQRFRNTILNCEIQMHHR